MFKFKLLYEEIFDNKVNANNFIIVTGYIGPAIIEDLQNLKYNSNVYVGMYGNSMSSELHNSLLDFSKKNKKIRIFYTKQQVHSKIYAWKNDKQIVKSLIGSANFSTNALRTPYKEVLGKLNESDYSELNKYLEYIESNSIPIYEANIKEFDEFVEYKDKFIDDRTISISLLSSTTRTEKNIIGVSTVAGNVPTASGLNWGFTKKGLSSPNDAYIKVTTQAIKKLPDLFPRKREDLNEPIDVIWDDGEKMQMLLEGSQEVNGFKYPKQIGSFGDKSILGEYIRKRIGEKINQNLVVSYKTKKEFNLNYATEGDKLLTKEILEKYGRTDIKIKKIGEDSYLFDFSTPAKV
jgi:hypothetical protein